MLPRLRRRKSGRKENEVKGEQKEKKGIKSGRKGICPQAVMFIVLWAMWSRRPSLGLRITAPSVYSHICMEKKTDNELII